MRKKPLLAPTRAFPKNDTFLTIRDNLAGHIASGLCASRAQHKLDMIAETGDEIAATAFLIADSMMTMRAFSQKEIRQFLEGKKLARELQQK